MKLATKIFLCTLAVVVLALAASGYLIISSSFQNAVDRECTCLLYTSRIMLRDHLSQQEAKRRIQSQGDYAEKRGKAKHIIDNSGSMGELEREVKRLYQQVGEICAEKRKRL